MVPNISSKHIGKTLSTEHLMDYIFHRPNSEVIDCFAKFTTYEQNIARYHKLTTIPLGKLPCELDFLCEIYCGWNKPNMTQAQFCEVQRKIENFPADDLKKIKSKLDMSNLETVGLGFGNLSSVKCNNGRKVAVLRVWNRNGLRVGIN